MQSYYTQHRGRGGARPGESGDSLARATAHARQNAKGESGESFRARRRRPPGSIPPAHRPASPFSCARPYGRAHGGIALFRAGDALARGARTGNEGQMLLTAKMLLPLVRMTREEQAAALGPLGACEYAIVGVTGQLATKGASRRVRVRHREDSSTTVCARLQGLLTLRNGKNIEEARALAAAETQEDKVVSIHASGKRRACRHCFASIDLKGRRQSLTRR